jgi:hypothetical protein
MLWDYRLTGSPRTLKFRRSELSVSPHDRKGGDIMDPREPSQPILPMDYPAAYTDELVTSAELAIHFMQQNLNIARDIVAKLRAEVRTR